MALSERLIRLSMCIPSSGYRRHLLADLGDSPHVAAARTSEVFRLEARASDSQRVAEHSGAFEGPPPHARGSVKSGTNVRPA